MRYWTICGKLIFPLWRVPYDGGMKDEIDHTPEDFAAALEARYRRLSLLTLDLAEEAGEAAVNFSLVDTKGVRPAFFDRRLAAMTRAIWAHRVIEQLRTAHGSPGRSDSVPPPGERCADDGGSLQSRCGESEGADSFGFVAEANQHSEAEECPVGFNQSPTRHGLTMACMSPRYAAVVDQHSPPRLSADDRWTPRSSRGESGFVGDEAERTASARVDILEAEETALFGSAHDSQNTLDLSNQSPTRHGLTMAPMARRINEIASTAQSIEPHPDDRWTPRPRAKARFLEIRPSLRLGLGESKRDEAVTCNTDTVCAKRAKTPPASRAIFFEGEGDDRRDVFGGDRQPVFAGGQVAPFRDGLLNGVIETGVGAFGNADVFRFAVFGDVEQDLDFSLRVFVGAPLRVNGRRARDALRVQFKGYVSPRKTVFKPQSAFADFFVAPIGNSCDDRLVKAGVGSFLDSNILWRAVLAYGEDKNYSAFGAFLDAFRWVSGSPGSGDLWTYSVLLDAASVGGAKGFDRFARFWRFKSHFRHRFDDFFFLGPGVVGCDVFWQGEPSAVANDCKFLIDDRINDDVGRLVRVAIDERLRRDQVCDEQKQARRHHDRERNCNEPPKKRHNEKRHDEKPLQQRPDLAA